MKSAKYITIVTLVLVLLMSSVLAQSEFELQLNEAAKQLQDKKLPGVLGTIFGDEKINFHISRNSGDKFVVGLITEGKMVKNITLNEISEPTLNVYLDEALIAELQSSENPLPVLKKALEENRLSYKAVGFFKKIKFAVLMTYADVVSAFTPEKEYKELPQNAEEKPAASENNNVEKSAEKPAGEEQSKESEAEKENTAPADTVTGQAVQQTEPEEEPEENSAKTYVVTLKKDGFEPRVITIKVGDTVVWENVRSGAIDKAMVFGMRQCSKIKSGLFNSGATYSWTFDKAGTCVIVDGIVTTIDSKVIVTE